MLQGARYTHFPVLYCITRVRSTNHDMLDRAYADMLRQRRHDTGRHGITAEQVVSCALQKQFRELSYDDPA